MKKNNLYFSALVLILGLSFTNCHSSSDNSLYQTNALLLNYVNGLLAGNCVTVQKLTNASSVVTYSATGYTIPSGGCNSATLGSFYTTTASEIVTKSDAYIDTITKILDTYSACSSMSSIVKGATSNSTINTVLATTTFTNSVKTATTSANITTLATANTADNETNGPKNCKTVKVGLLYTAGIFCSTSTDSTNAQSNFKYYVVNSVQSDMVTNFEGNRSILNLSKTTNDSINYYTKAAITAMRMMTSTEVATLTSSTISPKLDSYALVAGLYGNLASGLAAGNFTAFGINSALTTLISTAPSCLASLTAGDATGKDYAIRIPAAQYITTPTLNSDITFADKQAVTTPFIPFLNCKYGAGFTTATTTTTADSKAAIGICPSTYTQF